MSARVWAGGSDPPSPGGRVCPRGGASRPAGPSLQSLLVQFIHLLVSWFPDAGRPARQSARAGRRGLAPCEAPDWLRASGAAPGTSRAAMFTIESIASFRLRHLQAPRPAANRVRMRLAARAMGTRRPRETPRLRRGRIAGEVEDLGHRRLSSLSVSFAPVVRTQVAENKNRAADVPAELRHALHRRLPARRDGELGARVTSGRDSRETQSVNGDLRVVNPPHRHSEPVLVHGARIREWRCPASPGCFPPEPGEAAGGGTSRRWGRADPVREPGPRRSLTTRRSAFSTLPPPPPGGGALRGRRPRTAVSARG